jgi:hypothetical protein
MMLYTPKIKKMDNLKGHFGFLGWQTRFPLQVLSAAADPGFPLQSLPQSRCSICSALRPIFAAK